MQIYIPTRGRTNKQVTVQNLPQELRDRVTLVVDAEEYDEYPENYAYDLGIFRILPAPVGCNSIGKVRQFIIDYHHLNFSNKKLMMLDDDLGFNMRRTDIREKFVHATEDAIIEGFKRVEQLLDTYTHGGIRYRQMSQTAPDLDYNCRVLRALAYNTDVLKQHDIRFDRLIVMEDFDVTLQLLRLGYTNFSLSTIIQGQGSSNMAGGCSLYRDAQRQAEGANGLAANHPGFVKVRTKKTNWSNWDEGLRTDVTVFWKKAYESSQGKDKASA